jgi:hypothetical protein
LIQFVLRSASFRNQSGDFMDLNYGSEERLESFKGCTAGAAGALVCSPAKNGEEVRQATRRAKKYRARAAENIKALLIAP